MEMHDVEGSTNVSAIGHDAATKTLRIRFKSGAEYDYHDVPAALHEQFSAAHSKGRFFAGTIKDKFKHTKLK